MANEDEMDTITTVLAQLKLNGQGDEFAINRQGSIILKGKVYPPGEVSIIKTYRFEGHQIPPSRL